MSRTAAPARPVVSTGVRRKYLVGESAWMREGATDALRTIGTIRIPEFVLFFLLIFEWNYGLPIPFDVAQISALLMCVLIIFRRPLVELGNLQRLVPIFAVALLYLGIVSAFADPTADAADWKRRLFRMALVLTMVFCLASGRLDLRSGLIGLFGATVFNAVTFYAGIAPDYYGGVLSGWFYDKNVAGLGHAVYGFLAIFAFEKRWARLLVGMFAVGATYLTGSRTSIAALCAALIWYLVAPKLPLLGRYVLGLLIWFGFTALQEDFSRVGQFSDRTGSDLLRARIDAASEIRVKETPFTGQGLGEAYVHVQDQHFFFHNSYWTAIVEGGYSWLVFIVALTVFIGIRPFTSKLTKWEFGAQAATITLLLCSWRLGEVFLTAEWGLVMAFALQARWTSQNDDVLAEGPRSFAGTLDPRKGHAGIHRSPGDPA